MSEAYESDESLQAFHSCHRGYYSYGDLTTPSRTQWEFEKGLKCLEKTIGPKSPKSILDVGFGNGFFLALAQNRGWTPHGIDTSEKNVQVAKEKFSLELKKGSTDDLFSIKEQYDAVCFWDVIEHLPDPGTVLKQVTTLLKPGGALLIGVPNDHSLMAVIAHGLYQSTFKKFRYGLDKLYFLEHVSYFSLNSLTRLAKNNGFQRKTHFYSSTDLNKYSLPPIEKTIARTMLFLGRLMNLQNRLVTIFQPQ